MTIDLEPKWSLGDQCKLNLVSAIRATISNLIKEQIPELAALFPMRQGCNMNAHFDQGWLALTMTDRGGMAIPSVGALQGEELEAIIQHIPMPFAPESPEELHPRLGERWLSFDRFTYIGPWMEPCACWPHLEDHLLAWLNGPVVNEVERRNSARVLRAIPQAPQFDVDWIRSHLWVLECETSLKQGTAFSLHGIGIVTCDHVLGAETYAFRADAINRKYPVRVLSRNKDLDLALISLEGIDDGGLELGTADDVRELQQLAITGYPNYNLGDTGVFVPALVVGFRTRSAIRHILTNGPIVAGMSGGPALDASHKVIGVAVTGADQLAAAQDTEKHGIIPIDALRHIGT